MSSSAHDHHVLEVDGCFEDHGVVLRQREAMHVVELVDRDLGNDLSVQVIRW